MRIRILTAGVVSTLALVVATPALAQTQRNVAAPAKATAAPKAAATTSSDAAAIVKQVNIPYQSFTLPNGLRVLVHEDRKAPIVAVSIWYGVGSKHEPKGKTGFAHLFEHLMFNGSENAPDDFFGYTEALGATAQNGTTWFDRTNYFQNVPTGALDRMLFLEADRMGHLLGGVTQGKLDNQRMVVQNEKRQGDNQPYGMVEYEQLAGLLPPEHPYGHSTIGSMADLDAASLADVRDWFKGNYGPNNAVLVLAGDIDLATAKKLVAKNFGDIPRGPAIKTPQVSIPTLAAPVAKVMKDKVAQTRIYRSWTMPGKLDPDFVPLSAATYALGGLASSRLDNVLVREEKLVSSVSLNLQDNSQLSFLDISANVLPGQDPDKVAARLDAVIADFIKTGPTQDELDRVKMVTAAGQIRGLEEVGGFGGKAVTLAEGLLYGNDPELYKKKLAQLTALTPAQAHAAVTKWLTRPPLMIKVEPGERPAYEESQGVGATDSGKPKVSPDTTAAPPGPKRAFPPVTPVADVTFPKVETATLANGVRVNFARRTAIPTVSVALQFNAGYSADQANKTGLMKLMTGVVQEGTKTKNSSQLAEAEERLGAQINVGSSLDRTFFNANALTAKLGPTLDLLEDVVKNPAFDAQEIERLRTQQIAGIKSELTNPGGLAARAVGQALYGKNHGYALPPTGTVADVTAITRDDLQRAYAQWIRPDNLEIFVTGDTTLAAITKELNSRFGQWVPPASAKAQKNLTAPVAARERIVLVDRPGSPQSIIIGAQLLNTTSKEANEPLAIANDVLGGGGTARLFMDLREAKGWSYGAYSGVGFNENAVNLRLQAPVQQDKTGPSVEALRQNVREILSSKPITADEFKRAIDSRVLSLPGSYETSGAVLGQMLADRMRDRPANYVETLPGTYRKMTQADAENAAKRLIDPNKFVWVVVGDSAKIKPQLQALGMPIEEVSFDATATK